jgi:hypothetical protein
MPWTETLLIRMQKVDKMHRNGLLPVASPAPPWIGTSVPASVRRIGRRLIAAVGGFGTVVDQMRVRKYSFGNPDPNKGERRKGGERRKIPRWAEK